MIYLDNQATTPIDPRVLDAMLPYLTSRFGNPSSGHRYGREARDAVEASRQELSQALGSHAGREIVFTSGATESNNLAIKGVAAGLRSRGSHLITTAVEHKSLLATCGELEHNGFEITYLPVGRDGRVDPQRLDAAITPRTTLVSVMMANNETGVVQPLREISSITRRHGVLLHTDAAQGIGCVPFDVGQLGVDLASLSAHKLYGPKGVGALYVRRQGPHVPLVPQMAGGNQEHGLRSGTLNVPGIVGLARAASLVIQEGTTVAGSMLHLREKLRHRLTTSLDGVKVNGSLEYRLPGNLNVSFAGVDAEELLARLPDVALSGGSACSSGQAAPSHVLTAMGCSRPRARGAVRISIGRFNTEPDIRLASERIIAAVRQLRDAALAGV
jgi:cysteine desulfurase